MIDSYPVWAEVDLGAVAHNVREIRRITAKNAAVMAVVKANAYGHGAAAVSKAALEGGAGWLGVARVSEGAELRAAGIEAPVLVLGYTPPQAVATALRLNLSLTAYTLDMAVTAAGVAASLGVKARLHFKVDTGMGRLGWLPEKKAVQEILKAAGLPGVEAEGIYTHFAAADARDKTYTLLQLEKFLTLVRQLEKAGLEFPLRHAANSAAIMEVPDSHLDLVRAGIALYGLYPSDEVDRSKVGLKPALSLKARVAHVKEVPAGFAVSYGCTYVTSRPTVIATLPLGYADGYSRLLSSKGEVLLGGQRVPVVGRVCMDQIMVDAGRVPGVRPGDEAVLIGRQGGGEISADEVARWIGTINYEVTCMVSGRVPRVYTGLK